MATAAAAVARGKPLRQLLPFALLIVAALAFGRSDGQFPNAPLLVAQAFGALAFLPNNPAWAVAPLLVVELTLNDYILNEAGLSVRLAVAIVAAAVSAKLVLG